jgi:hypothetical protein
LEDDVLIRRSAIMSRILELADAKTCAAITMGQPTQGLEPVLRHLSREDIEQWFDLTFQAMTAELRQSPDPPANSDAAIERLARRLLADLSLEDRRPVASLLAASPNLSVEDTCRGGRLLFARLGELPRRAHAALARALVTQ